MTTLDATHDRGLRSWVASANTSGCDFPIQNLPFGRFRRLGSAESWRIGTAIGDQVLDLRAAGLIDTDDMNVLMAAAPSERHALRARISAGLREGSERQVAWPSALLPPGSARDGHRLLSGRVGVSSNQPRGHSDEGQDGIAPQEAGLDYRGL